MIKTLERHIFPDGTYSISLVLNNILLGMKFTELYEQCKRSFYVNNEQNLRLQLTEFIDHRLIKLGKSINDGQEIVRLLITEQDIVEQLPDKLN